MNNIQTELKYLKPSDIKPIYYASEGGKDAELSMSGEFEMRMVTIQNARGKTNPGNAFSLDREGFTFLREKSCVNDYYNEEEIKDTYLPETEFLIARITGASRVICFDHTFRSDNKNTRSRRKSREPSAVVHNDYTTESGVQRLKDILGKEADEIIAKQRFTVTNVWRPLTHPVYSTPLAVCDAQSVASEDLIEVERHAKDRIGENLLAMYNPEHKWYFFDEMLPEEALLIKTFDSDRHAQTRSCIHTAFSYPDNNRNTTSRESIEVRAFAIFE